MNLIIVREPERVGGTFTLTDERARHIRSVLKLSVGDAVDIGVVDGPWGLARVVEINDQSVTIEVEKMVTYNEPLPPVDLIVALPRPQTLKKVLWSCGSMGVRRLHLIRANRVEKSYYESPLLESGNYEKYLIEGMSQGRQTRMPRLFIHERFKPFFEDHLPLVEGERRTTRFTTARIVRAADHRNRS